MSEPSSDERLSVTQRLGELALTVQRHHKEGQAAAIERLNAYQRVGNALREAKALCPAGTFGKWVEENCPFSHGSAARYMKFAEIAARADPEEKEYEFARLSGRYDYRLPYAEAKEIADRRDKAALAIGPDPAEESDAVCRPKLVGTPAPTKRLLEAQASEDRRMPIHSVVRPAGEPDTIRIRLYRRLDELILTVAQAEQFVLRLQRTLEAKRR